MPLSPFQLYNNYQAAPSSMTDMQRLMTQSQQTGQPMYYGPGAFAAYARYQAMQNQQPTQVPPPPATSVAPPPSEPTTTVQPQVEPAQEAQKPVENLGFSPMNASRALLESNPNRAAMFKAIASFF